MSSKNMDYLMPLVVVLLSALLKLSTSSEPIARALDLSWRPLSHSPYHQQQFFQGNQPAALISYSHFDQTKKDEIVEVAKHNAQLLKKFKEIAHQPITSYSDPYQVFSQTPGPSTKFVSTTAFHNSNLARHQHQHQQQHVSPAASQHVLSRVPYPGKSAPLYQTKLNYLGKPDSNAAYHQNSIHQTIATTPKVAGFTKEHGRVSVHYHHPSYGMTQISSTTKRIPMFSSSVTPHPHTPTKIHPVINKFQAHMALAAASQSHHNKLKHHAHLHHQNIAFSPPSQLMSNYNNFGPATSNPFWHAGSKQNNAPFAFIHDNRDFHHYVHKIPESQQQQQHPHYHQIQQNYQPNPQQHLQNQLSHQQNLQNYHQQQQQQHQQHQHQQVFPSVHPSILTPFLEQVQIKQKEAAAAEQKNSVKQSHEANSQENNGSFEIINDVFSKHLVPPPPNPSHSSFKSKPSNAPEKQEKVNKYNLSMPSPLQDASRFNYENVVSTATPSAPSDILRFKPSASDNLYLSTEKPNVFIHLNNRTKENVYKQHKLLHPSYTGGKPKRPSVIILDNNKQKPFLPTPYKPERPQEEYLKVGYEPQHSFFTIEDAVTPNLRYEVIKGKITAEEGPEVIVYEPSKIPDYEHAVTLAYKTPSTTITTAAPIEQSTPKPRQKLRRRKPRPQQQKTSTTEASEDQVKELTTVRPNRVRGSVKNSEDNNNENLRTRNRVNHPNRVRSRVNFSSPAATSSTTGFDYDSTVRSSTEEEKRNELTTAHQAVTEATSTSLRSDESSEQPENLKRRVRLRYKNKLVRPSTNSLEAADFKSKLSDNQISDTEHDSIVIKQQSDETTEGIVTDSGFSEIRSSLKLPNLKLRNEALTTLPTTADTISTSSIHPTSTTVVEQDDNNILNKIANRPRFSIKEYKRKQLTSSSTASTSLTSASTAATTTKPDSSRFNRLRLNLNRRRNETSDSGEETEPPRRRYSTQRPTTTESTVQATSSAAPKRGTLPRRTFPARNFTKPTVNLADNESTTSLKPLVKNVTSFGSNRPTSPNLRSRIQSYKRKEASNEISDTTPDAIRNINLSSETTVTHEQPSTTTSEPSFKHETSIMKIAKTPSSVSVEKTTHSLFDDATDVSRSDFDLTGSPSEHSQRVAELTISGNDYSFKSANIGPLSRRIPNYFTISTDDPILPIQAFFPQIKTNENN